MPEGARSAREPSARSPGSARPARDGRVADDDRDQLGSAAKIARGRESLPDRQPRSSVAAVEDVVLRLGAPGETADATELAECREAIEAACQQLVRVRLVAGVPHDPIAG